MIIKNKLNKNGALAISQIFILMIGIIAVSYAIGSEVRVVRAGTTKYEPGPPPGATPIPGVPGGYYYKDSVGRKLMEDKIAKGLESGISKETGKESSGFLEWQGYGKGFLGNIAEGVVWAGIVFAALQLLSSFVSEDYKEAVKTLSWAAGGGIIAGKILYGAGLKGGLLGATGIGILVGAYIFLTLYAEERQEIITFTSYPWEAPVKGENCHLCNEQKANGIILPCSEYQCKSLGQACELVNPGTDEEKCVWVDKKDIKFPTIEPWNDALTKDYKYTPTGQISPPDRGVNIEYNGGCVPAFTPLSFGINVSEPAKCKIDYLRKKNFDDMDFYFGGSSLFKELHKQTMSLPGSKALEAEGIEIKNNGDYELYVMCQDANGNSNTANFVFKFCVDKGPDTTPPLIVTTDLLNGQPIGFNKSSVNILVYVNEPSECKWSHRDQAYDNMEEIMSCSSSVLEMNAQMLYKCNTTLTSLKDRVENKFYFRCKDQPVGVDEINRNVNTESYKFNLIGTQPLVIDSVKPENESVIKDSTDVVKVTLEAKTSAGYKEGEATCYFHNGTDEENKYVMFFSTNSYQHSQDLYLPNGEYLYFIKCVDTGGNTDYSSTSFSVESDSSSPIIVRAYHEETYLKLVTDEKAECVYDTKNCNYLFEDGIAMANVDKIEHFIEWDTKTDLYIKCQDIYGIRPFPNECSMIARPFNV